MNNIPFLEDISVGDEIPPLTKSATTRQLVMYAGASGDFYEIHYDQEFARKQDLPGVIIHGALKSAFLGQLMTDWVGAEGNLKSLSVRYRDMDGPGDLLSCKGVVTSINKETATVSCDIWIERDDGRKTTTGEATVILPSKESNS